LPVSSRKATNAPLSRASRLVVLLLAGLLAARFELGGHVGHDQQATRERVAVGDWSHRQREVAVAAIEALGQLLERDLGGQDPVGHLFPAERQEQARPLVVGRHDVGERLRRAGRREPPVEGGGPLGVQPAVDADRGQALLDVVEHHAERRVARGQLLGARRHEPLEVRPVLFELDVPRLQAREHLVERVG